MQIILLKYTTGRIVSFSQLDFKEGKGLVYREKCLEPRPFPSLTMGFGNGRLHRELCRYDVKMQLMRIKQ